MKTMQFATTRNIACAAAVVLGAAACSSDNTPAVTPLSNTNAPMVASSVTQGMDFSLEALNHDGIDINGLLGGFGSPALGFASSGGQPAGLFSLTGCPSFTPDPAPDADGDGVPDNTLYTFSADNCTFQGQGGTLLITGSVRVSDPASVAIGFDVAVNQLSFSSTEVGATDPSFSVVIDGTRSLRGQPTSLTLDEDLGVTVRANGQDAGWSSQGSFNFTAAQGATIDFDLPLPDGTVDWNGTFSAQGPEGFFVLNVQTVQLLTYEAACIDPDSGDGSIVDGVLRVAAGSNEGAGIVQITFKGCGVEPDVVFIGATA